MFLFKNILVSQTNLIRNPSFEHYTLLNCIGGPSTVNNWSDFMSPDYNSIDCLNSYRGIPYNNFGVSYPKHGNAFMGFISYVRTNTAKEYPYQQLLSALIADSIYCLSFFVSRADYIPYAIKNIGALFTAANPGSFGGISITATPQVVNQSGFITDTIGWTEIKSCFTAIGGEKYITIGNFNDNANTDTLFVGTTNQVTGGNGYAYYFIDSVSLWQNNFPTSINEMNKNEVVSVYPNPTLGKLKLLCQNLKDIEHCVVKIMDVLGREVKQLNFEEEIDITELEKGIYFLSLYKSKTLIGTKKIVRE